MMRERHLGTFVDEEKGYIYYESDVVLDGIDQLILNSASH